MNIKGKWENLSPKHKQYAMLALALGVIGIVVALVSPSNTETSRNKQIEVIDNILTSRSTREISLDAMASRLIKLEEQKKEGDREVAKLEQELERLRRDAGSAAQTQRELAQLRGKLQNIDQKNDLVRKQTGELEQKLDGFIEMESSPLPRTVAPGSADDYPEYQVDGPSAPADESSAGSPSDMWDAPIKQGPLTTESEAEHPQSGESRQAASADAGALNIVDVGDGYSSDAEGNGQNPDGAGDKPGVDDKEEEISTYIPGGSLLTGSLLTGLDAPTGQGARRDPFPVVMRIQKEAILPNNFTADVRECFVILAGYGELSSERVMLRSEGISCVREDGKTVETRLEAYAAGEDGKAGVRGRLVTKQGAMVARSMVAGFFEGLSGAFDVSPVPILNTESSGQQQFVDAFSPETVTSGLVGGAQSSLGKIADFYLKMADAMFPILELDAGRKIDLIMVRGSELKFGKNL